MMPRREADGAEKLEAKRGDVELFRDADNDDAGTEAAAPGNSAAARDHDADAAADEDDDAEDPRGEENRRAFDVREIVRLGLGASANIGLSSSAPAAAGSGGAAARWGRHERRRAPDIDDVEEGRMLGDEEIDLEALNRDAKQTNRDGRTRATRTMNNGTPALPRRDILRGDEDDLESGALSSLLDDLDDEDDGRTRPLLSDAAKIGARADDAAFLMSSPGQNSTASRGSTASANECRICGDDECTKENPLIAPCACTGSISKVHVECLEKWILNRPGNRAAGDNLDCEICHTRYNVALHHRLRLDFKSLCSLVTLSDLLEAAALIVSATCLASALIVDLPAMHVGHPDQNNGILLIVVSVWVIGLIAIALRRLFIRWRRTTSVPRVRALTV